MKIEKCRVMNSKMRLLWILFQNWDQHGGDSKMIMAMIYSKISCGTRSAVYCTSPEHRGGTMKVVLNAETPNRRMACSRRDDCVQELFTNRQMKALTCNVV
ncbi:hypothetical protein CBL_21078 [Carabus blaptoides fortunei]